MAIPKFKMFSLLMLVMGLMLVTAPVALSQGNTTVSSRTVASGEKMKIKGVVTRRDADTFTVRDNNGVDTIVQLTDRTSVKAKGGFLRSGANYAQTQILRGLNLEVEGRGSSNGELVADKVRFNESDLRVARAVESRAAPLEDRAHDLARDRIDLRLRGCDRLPAGRAGTVRRRLLIDRSAQAQESRTARHGPDRRAVLHLARVRAAAQDLLGSLVVRPAQRP